VASGTRTQRSVRTVERRPALTAAPSTASSPETCGCRSPANVEAVWKQLTLAQKRAILDAVADVTVLPTAATRNRRGFDPDSVRIDWKVS
jgi:hypothetical protein